LVYGRFARDHSAKTQQEASSFLSFCGRRQDCSIIGFQKIQPGRDIARVVVEVGNR